MNHMSVEEILEFEKELGELMERSENGAVVIVEGARDRECLILLGVRGRIVEASNRPADDIAEEVCTFSNDVLIFTDADRRGLVLAERLLKAFECRGVIPDIKISRRMLSLCRVKSVESMAARYFSSLEATRF